MRRDGDTFTVQLEIRSGDVGTHRELSSPSCETLLDATALLAAAIAEETATVQAATATLPREASVPAPARPAAAAAAPSPRGPDASAPPPPRLVHPASRRSLELYADGRMFTGLGVAPDVDLGGGGALGLALRHAAVEIGGSAALPRRARVPGVDAEVRISAWFVEARGCGRISLGRADRVHALPCASIFAGGYDSESRGAALARRGDARDLWVAAGLGPMLTLRLHRRLGLVAGVEGLAFLRRPAVAIERYGDVLRVRPLGVRAVLGVRVRFSVTDRTRRKDVVP